MGTLGNMYRGRNDFDFPKGFRRAGIVSLVLVIGSIITIAVQGVALSIDFEGGSIWEVPSDNYSDAQAEAVIAAADAEDDRTIVADKFQEAESVDGSRVLRISGRVETEADQAADNALTPVEVGAEVANALAADAGLDPDEVNVNTVGPSWGEDITRQAVISLIVFMVLVALYITWRLEARMAVAALAAVVHDILITVGVYSLFQITIAPATVISFLTILGFSLYDTIVVYDRVQENANRLGRTGRYTYTAIMRRSLNQVVMRSINTTITTLLPIISMLVVGSVLLDQTTLGDFSLALLIGLLLGTYSSLFVAAPLTVWLKEREPRWREIRSRMEARGQDPSDSRWYGIGADAAPAMAAAAAAPGASQTTSEPATGKPAAKRSDEDASGDGPAGTPKLTPMGHPPRPRKKRKR
ncbi:MAG: protein translocase subunit SecF [Microthrixaceae bacterium]